MLVFLTIKLPRSSFRSSLKQPFSSIGDVQFDVYFYEYSLEITNVNEMDYIKQVL